MASAIIQEFKEEPSGSGKQQQHQVSVVMDAPMQSQAVNQLVQGADGNYYVSFGDGQQALIDPASLVNITAAPSASQVISPASTATISEPPQKHPLIVTQVHPPKASNTQAAQVRSVQQGAVKPSPPTKTQQPQMIDLTSQPKPAKVIELNAPKPKVIELNNRVPQQQNRPVHAHPNQQISKILQGGTPNSQQPATRPGIISVPKRKMEVVSGGAPQGPNPPPAKRQQLTVEEVKPPTQAQQTTQSAPQKSNVAEPSSNNAITNQVYSKKVIPPLTEAESKSLSELTNSLFESMTGFQGFIVQSIADRLEQTYSYTYMVNGIKLGPLQPKIRLFLIRIRLGLRYPALAEIFGFEIESAQRFCREVSELFHYALQQKKITTLAVPAKKKDQAECSGKAVIEIQTEIPLEQTERFHFYSPKNKMHTVKFLVAIGPDGGIIFVSNAYRGNTTDDTLVQDCGVQNFVTRNLPDAKALPFIKTAVKTMKRFEVLHFVPQDFLPEMDGILPVVAHLAKYFPAQICTPQSRK